jgi:hypothetical protein
MPSTYADPDVGASRPHIMRMVVDLPAPLAPRKPKISPSRTVSETPSTALKAPKCLHSCSSWTAGWEEA